MASAPRRRANLGLMSRLGRRFRIGRISRTSPTARRGPAMSEETLFTQALEKADPAQRAAFLDAACGDNRALRARLEALLGSHEQASSFLESPAVARPHGPPS